MPSIEITSLHHTDFQGRSQIAVPLLCRDAPSGRLYGDGEMFEVCVR